MQRLKASAGLLILYELTTLGRTGRGTKGIKPMSSPMKADFALKIWPPQMGVNAGVLPVLHGTFFFFPNL